jgi:hypothetical protein
MTLEINIDEIHKAVLCLNVVLGIIANVFGFHILKHDFVGGTFHHYHPHTDQQWWTWQPNTVLNNICIATAIDTFSCFFALLTFMIKRPKSATVKRLRWVWDNLNLTMAIVSVLMIGGAANLVLPLYLYNDHLGPCLVNSTLSTMQHKHEETYHSSSHGHSHRALMHTPSTIVDGISDDMTVPPYHIPVFDSGNLNSFTGIILSITALKLYIVPNFGTVFRVFL